MPTLSALLAALGLVGVEPSPWLSGYEALHEPAEGVPGSFLEKHLLHVQSQGLCDASLVFAMVEAARAANLRAGCVDADAPLPSVGEAVFCAPLLEGVAEGEREAAGSGDCGAQSVQGLLAYFQHGLSSAEWAYGFEEALRSAGRSESAFASDALRCPHAEEIDGWRRSSVPANSYGMRPVRLFRSWRQQVFEFMQVLLDVGPVVTRILDAEPESEEVFRSEFSRQAGVIDRGAIRSFSRDRRGTEIARHVLLVGWGRRESSDGSAVRHWIVKTSWGADWGQGGFFHIEIFHDSLGVADAGTDRSGFKPFAVTVPPCLPPPAPSEQSIVPFSFASAVADWIRAVVRARAAGNEGAVYNLMQDES